MIPIEKKEIRGLTIGQFVTILLFLVSILATGFASYNTIINKLNNQGEAIKSIQTDKQTQELINRSLDLKNQELEKRILRIETLMKMEK